MAHALNWFEIPVSDFACAKHFYETLLGGVDPAPMLVRAQQAGATVIVHKTEIGDGFGFFAHFVDTEGNKLGLHSMG